MILVICGPSGVGKTTLVHRLMALRPRLTFSVSHTTRGRRGSERNGIHYHFVSQQTFADMVVSNAFVEHAQVHNHHYGTAQATLAGIEALGRDAVLDIDYQGAEQVRRAVPEAVLVLIAPPSMQALEDRLRGRATDTDEQVRMRLAKAREELSQYESFQYLVVNDRIEPAVERLDAIYRAELARVSRNLTFLTTLLESEG